MNAPVDNHFVSQLEQKLEKTSLKRVDSDVADKLIPRDDAPETILTEEQVTSVKDLFGKAVDNSEMTIEVESLSPDEPPVTVTIDEFTQRMKNMRSEEHTSELQSLMRTSYDIFCLKKKKTNKNKIILKNH